MALTGNLSGSLQAHRILACLIGGFILICHIFRHALMACESHIKCVGCHFSDRCVPQARAPFPQNEPFKPS